MKYVILGLLVGAVFSYVICPLVLRFVEITFLRRIHNWSIGNGFSSCAHKRVVQTNYYGGRCVDCLCHIGEGSKCDYTREELEEQWKREEAYYTALMDQN